MLEKLRKKLKKIISESQNMINNNMGCDFRWEQGRISAAQSILEELETIEDDKRNAERYKALRELVTFKCGRYDGPDYLENASESWWHLSSKAHFKGSSGPPKNLDIAVDEYLEAKESLKDDRG